MPGHVLHYIRKIELSITTNHSQLFSRLNTILDAIATEGDMVELPIHECDIGGRFIEPVC